MFIKKSAKGTLWVYLLNLHRLIVCNGMKRRMHTLIIATTITPQDVPDLLIHIVEENQRSQGIPIL